MKDKHNVIIIGSGPAGYTAGIYAARANLKPIIISGPMKGGQLITTTEVENYPGFPNGVNGPELMNNMLTQALNLGVEVIEDIVSNVEIISENEIILTTINNNIYETKSVIIATGSSPNKLNIKNEEESWNNGGISTCATCDGAFYRNKDVCVVGGGDTALEEAIYLSNICNSVDLYVRGTTFKGSAILVERIKAIENINIFMQTEIVEFTKDDGFKKGFILKTTLETNKLEAEVTYTNSTEVFKDGVFIAVGSNPNTEFLVDSGIYLTPEGYVDKPINGSTQTNISGVFVAGDVADPIFKQAIISAGSGSMAAIECEKFLNH